MFRLLAKHHCGYAVFLVDNLKDAKKDIVTKEKIDAEETVPKIFCRELLLF